MRFPLPHPTFYIDHRRRLSIHLCKLHVAFAHGHLSTWVVIRAQFGTHLKFRQTVGSALVVTAHQWTPVVPHHRRIHRVKTRSIVPSTSHRYSTAWWLRILVHSRAPASSYVYCGHGCMLPAGAHDEIRQQETPGNEYLDQPTLPHNWYFQSLLEPNDTWTRGEDIVLLL